MRARVVVRRLSSLQSGSFVSLIALVAGLGASATAFAQTPSQPTEPPASNGTAPTDTPAVGSAPSATPSTPANAKSGASIPQITVTAAKAKTAGPKTQRAVATRPSSALAPVTQQTAPPVPSPFDSTSAAAHVTPQDVPSLGKTGTPLANLPMNVQIIPRAILNQQGDTMLRQAITNASGVNQGGQDSLGYFDHFLIRGFNAQIYEDGFSDGDQLGGISHSLNGVKSIEVLEGPGSALFGSGPPGGTINMAHYTPSSTFHYGDSVTMGSFGTITNQGYVTGPTTIEGLNYRVDGTVSRSDGFRDLGSHDYEIRPDFTWAINNHDIEVSLDARDIHQTPDSYGLIYFHGNPIGNVPINSRYSTPWAFANENYFRPTVTDKWWVSDFLTINNRFAYTHRTLDVERNGDSASTIANIAGPNAGLVTNRQLREQEDLDNSYDYQFEPVWKFYTGSVGHTLLTGFEALHQTTATSRETASLPNVVTFAPIPTETPATTTFQCDATHSCDDDRLAATYLSTYATDQIDVTDRFKVRAGIRYEWWDTSLLPLISVSGRFNSNGMPILAGEEEDQKQTPLSWNVGALYKLLPGVSVFGGVSKSWLSNFNSENTQQGIGPAESGMQYEGGLRFASFDDKIVLNTAVFRVLRNDVAVAFTPIAGSTIEEVAFDDYKVDGVEASLDARITDQWHVLANATAMDPVVTASPQTVVQSTVLDHAPQGVPRYLANLWTTYDFSIAGIHGFQVGAGVNYQDKSYSDNTNVNSIPAATVLNAEVAYLSPTWDVILNVKNLTNARYFVAANAAGAYVADPLSAFLTIRFKQ
jgi:iron complex outermembrane recepter protein